VADVLSPSGADLALRIARVVLAMDEVVDVGVATVAAGRESYPLGESGPGGSTDLDILVLLKSQ
jgi:hypothetical protein